MSVHAIERFARGAVHEHGASEGRDLAPEAIDRGIAHPAARHRDVQVRHAEALDGEPLLLGREFLVLLAGHAEIDDGLEAPGREVREFGFAGLGLGDGEELGNGQTLHGCLLETSPPPGNLGRMCATRKKAPLLGYTNGTRVAKSQG